MLAATAESPNPINQDGGSLPKIGEKIADAENNKDDIYEDSVEASTEDQESEADGPSVIENQINGKKKDSHQISPIREVLITLQKEATKYRNIQVIIAILIVKRKKFS